MEKDVFSVLVWSPGIGRNGRGVELSPHRESDVEPFSKRGYRFDGIDRTRGHLDPAVLER